MIKSGKVWGETTTLLKTPLVELHHLTIYPRSACSWHMHERKWNAFYVIKGTLYIEAQKKAYPMTDLTDLRPGDITTLPPGEFHRFRSGVAGVECLELYYPEPLSEDIIRKALDK